MAAVSLDSTVGAAYWGIYSDFTEPRPINHDTSFQVSAVFVTRRQWNLNDSNLTAEI